jgi:hypothetical protein
MFIVDWFDSLVQGAWERARKRNRDALRTNYTAEPETPNTMTAKTFTVREAMNGKYIEFRKFKYNPSGPDTHEQCVYIVKDNETVLDAISVVLVLMDKS